MKYQFILDAKKEYPVIILCNVMKVSTSGYYSWKITPIAGSKQKKLDLIKVVKDIHQENEESYGSRRMSDALKEKGHSIGRTGASTLMKMADIKVKTKRKYKATTDSRHQLAVSPNLLNRNFAVDAPDKVWVSDITYIWTKVGWLYLAVIIDLFSRRIVGWSTSRYINTRLIVDALNMAYWRRKPLSGLIFHTDRGSQYCSKEFQSVLNAYGMKSSMSRKGDCWDNAVAESFFATIKTEKIRDRLLLTRDEAHNVIFNYIEMFYNARRFHSYLGNVSPRIFEERWQAKIAA